jgi:diguanylate cyclase (GGDEF)-like protein
VAPTDRSALLRKVIATQNEIVAAGLDLDAVMNRVVHRAKDLTAADASVVEIAEGEHMVYTAAAGAAELHIGVRLKVAASLSGLSVLTGDIQRCDDTAKDDRVDLDACMQIGARSMVCVPLRYDDRVVGVLKVYDERAHAFDDGDIEVLELLSGLIGAHMAHASLFAQSEHDGRHDPLTGLQNRRSYDERLVVATANVRRYGSALCLCLLDLDGFKSVNDTFGHPTGDAVLQEVADILRTGRIGDEVFRIGADEFAILMPETGRQGADLVATRLAEAIQTARLGDGRMTTSFGVAEANGGGALDLHESADQALYAAKRARSNGVATLV